MLRNYPSKRTLLKEKIAPALKDFGPEAAPYILSALRAKSPEPARALLVGYGPAAAPAIEKAIASPPSLSRKKRERFLEECRTILDIIGQ